MLTYDQVVELIGPEAYRDPVIYAGLSHIRRKNGNEALETLCMIVQALALQKKALSEECNKLLLEKPLKPMKIEGPNGIFVFTPPGWTEVKS